MRRALRPLDLFRHSTHKAPTPCPPDGAAASGDEAPPREGRSATPNPPHLEPVAIQTARCSGEVHGGRGENVPSHARTRTNARRQVGRHARTHTRTNRGLFASRELRLHLSPVALVPSVSESPLRGSMLRSPWSLTPPFAQTPWQHVSAFHRHTADVAHTKRSSLIPTRASHRFPNHPQSASENGGIPRVMNGRGSRGFAGQGAITNARATGVFFRWRYKFHPRRQHIFRSVVKGHGSSQRFFFKVWIAPQPPPKPLICLKSLRLEW